MKALRRTLADRVKRGSREPGRRRRRGSAGFARTRWGLSAMARSNVSPLRRARHRRLGPGERCGALSLQELRTHLQLPDQDADGATAQKGRWLDHAQAMIEGTSVAKAAERCDVHASTAFRRRHRFLGSPALDKPKTLTGIVEADETFILKSFKGRRSDLPRRPRKRGGKAKHPGLFFENIPILVARDRDGATVDAVLPNVDRASIAAVLDGVVTPANRFVCDGGKAIVAFARRANIPVHVAPAPGKPSPEAPDFHLNNVNAYHGRLKEWMRRFHGVATKNLPNYLGWRRALEAWGDQANPQNWILGAIGMGPQQLTQ